MATELQYKVFRELYDEESERYSSLEGRARLYFSIDSLYLGAIAFKASDVQALAAISHVPLWLFLVAGGLLVMSLLFTILAIQIRNFEGVCDPEEVMDSFGDKPPKDADFLDDRIVDLAVATNRNSLENDSTAKFLSYSAGLLFGAVLLHLLIFVVAVL